jgi:hypothetical protein
VSQSRIKMHKYFDFAQLSHTVGVGAGAESFFFAGAGAGLTKKFCDSKNTGFVFEEVLQSCIIFLRLRNKIPVPISLALHHEHHGIYIFISLYLTL